MGRGACFNVRMNRFTVLVTCSVLVLTMFGCGTPSTPKKPEVTPFAAAMTGIEKNFNQLKLCQATGWQAPADHPDLVPAKEAASLKAGLQNAGRHLAPNRNEEFKTLLREAEASAQSLEDALRANTTDEYLPRFKTLEVSCQKCHSKYRG
jgi:cytochrome c556